MIGAGSGKDCGQAEIPIGPLGMEKN